MKNTQKKQKKLLVGITGGIGSGKSTVSRIFAEAGYPVLSADLFARELTEKGAAALHDIRDLFGEKAITVDGNLDRAHLRERILADESLRKKLEAILHPKIQALTVERAANLFAQGKEIVFYEAPLLFEARSEHHMDLVICVFAPDEQRVARVMARDNSSREQAEKLLASQMPQDEKMRRADLTILNDGDLATLRERALEALGKVKLEPTIPGKLKRMHRLAIGEISRLATVLRNAGKR